MHTPTVRDELRSQIDKMRQNGLRGYVHISWPSDEMATLLDTYDRLLAALKLVSEYIEQPKETGIDLYGVFGLHATRVREAVAAALLAAQPNTGE